MGEIASTGAESGTSSTDWVLPTCDDHMGSLEPSVQDHDGWSVSLRFEIGVMNDGVGAKVRRKDEARIVGTA